MTPNELYCLTPIRKDYSFEDSLNILKDISTVSGQSTFFSNLYEINHRDAFQIIDNEKLLEIRYYLEQGQDDYIFKLGSLFFKNEPLLIFHRANEDGRDHRAFLTNPTLFEDLTHYISEKINQTASSVISYPCDQDIMSLDNVNGYELAHYYKFSEPDYKKNDLVWAYVPESFGQPEEQTSFVITKVKIKDVCSNSLLETYRGIQTERVLINQDIIYSTTSKSSSYNLSVHLNDALILGKVSDIPTPENAIHLYSDENGYLNPYFEGLTLEQIYTIYTSTKSTNQSKKKNI